MTTGTESSARGYPSLMQAMGLLLLAIVLQVVVGTAIGLMMGGVQGLERSPSVWGLLNLLALSPVIYYGWRRAGGTRDVLPLRPVPWAVMAPILLLVVGVAILISQLDNFLQLILGPPPLPLDVTWLFLGEPTHIAETLFLLVLVAPVTEELLCRGIILRGLLSQYPRGRAVVLSAVLFAVLHLNPWQFTGAFVLGIVFGWLYVRLRSLVPCMLGHAVANGFPVIVALAIPEIPAFTTPASDVARFQPLWLDLLGLLLIVSGAVWLRHRLRRGKPSADA